MLTAQRTVTLAGIALRASADPPVARTDAHKKKGAGSPWEKQEKEDLNGGRYRFDQEQNEICETH